MRNNRFYRTCCIALVSALLVSALILPKAYAARAIETARTDCSIEVNVRDAGAVELNELPVKVNFYKVAEVSAVGAYTAISELSGSDMEKPLDFSDLDSDTKASAWMEKAVAAKEAVEEVQMQPTASCEIKNGKALVDNLSVGLYLVDAQQAESETYTYNFTPYLISLPNNYYSAADEMSVDEWVYDLVEGNAVSLKTERKDRFGDLEITKELKAFNETIGGATFVFQIEATKVDADTEEQKVVYSDVVSMTFKNPGKDRIVIEDIPAGAEVVVTEVYSGASYTLESDKEVMVTIEAEETIEVSFTNTFDGRLNGGYGVVNHFVYDTEKQEWIWEATEDSTQDSAQ